MSLNAWEQQALDSIKDGLTGSDPDLAALLSAFTRLESDEDLPDREKIRTGSRPALRRLRRARRRAAFRRICQRLGIQRAALLLWLLTTAALIAVTLSLNSGSDHVSCTGWLATACTTPPPGHGSSPTPRDTPTSQAPSNKPPETSKPDPRGLR
jgi:hypothetical protein